MIEETFTDSMILKAYELWRTCMTWLSFETGIITFLGAMHGKRRPFHSKLGTATKIPGDPMTKRAAIEEIPLTSRHDSLRVSSSM